MNKFEATILPAKIEKRNTNDENKEHDKSPEEIKQYLATKFVEIFNEKINMPNPVIGKPNMQDPEIMRIFINSSLQELCEDPNIDTETAKTLNGAIRSSDMFHGMNAETPEDAKQYDVPLGSFEKHATTALYTELEKIFPEDVMNLIRGKI